MLINAFLIPRPPTGSSEPPTKGPLERLLENFTWYGFWTAEQLSQIMVEFQMSLVDPVSPGAQNNLYIAALDIIVTKAMPRTRNRQLVGESGTGRTHQVDVFTTTDGDGTKLW